MNATVCRNGDGVLLDYGDASERYDFRRDLKQHRGDRERIAVLKAEHALVILEIIFEHLEISDAAHARAHESIFYIARALKVERRGLGMPTVRVSE